jgi:hypothetical protein
MGDVRGIVRLGSRGTGNRPQHNNHAPTIGPQQPPFQFIFNSTPGQCPSHLLADIIDCDISASGCVEMATFLPGPA